MHDFYIPISDYMLNTLMYSGTHANAGGQTAAAYDCLAADWRPGVLEYSFLDSCLDHWSALLILCV